jgi:hypothetical protein
MIKIAKSRSIWATSIGYVNDVSERDHYFGLVRDYIPVFRRDHRLNDATIFDKLLQDEDPGFVTHPFVASFSAEPDSLPQWRSYCPNGNGVSIGFRVECLKRAFLRQANNSSGEPVPPPFISYNPVEYLDGANSAATIEMDLAKAVAASAALANKKYVKEGVETTAGDYLKAFLERRACFVKHPSFSNESEHRLLADGVFNKVQHLNFRPTRSTLVPYVSVSIPPYHSSHRDPPLSRTRSCQCWQGAGISLIAL